MDITTYTCPICDKEAEIIEYGTYYSWEHKCLHGVELASNKIFDSKEATRDNWGEYCSLLQEQIDFEYSHGLHDGCEECRENG